MYYQVFNLSDNILHNNCTGVHSESNVGLQSEMYQLSLSPDEFVIKQRGQRHKLQPLCLSFTDYIDPGM